RKQFRPECQCILRCYDAGSYLAVFPQNSWPLVRAGVSHINAGSGSWARVTDSAGEQCDTQTPSRRPRLRGEVAGGDEMGPQAGWSSGAVLWPEPITTRAAASQRLLNRLQRVSSERRTQQEIVGSRRWPPEP